MGRMRMASRFSCVILGGFVGCLLCPLVTQAVGKIVSWFKL